MLSAEQIDSIKDVIVKKFNPLKIYLFGSYAQGAAREESDLDLLVVDEFEGNQINKAFSISKALFPRDYGLDVVCYSEKEFQQKLRENWFILSEITSKGRLLYERN